MNHHISTPAMRAKLKKVLDQFGRREKAERVRRTLKNRRQGGQGGDSNTPAQEKKSDE